MSRRLIAVSLFTRRSGMYLMSPLRTEIPWAEMMCVVLNAALLVKYPRLSICASVEGGVQGRVGRWRYVELENGGDLFGLCNPEETGGFHESGSQPIDWVGMFYTRLLRQLFCEPIRSGERMMRPGAILWLPYEGSDAQLEAWAILKLVLQRVMGRKAPALVQEKLRGLGSFSRYLRGLTDEEIVSSFVPPPWFSGTEEP